MIPSKSPFGVSTVTALPPCCVRLAKRTQATNVFSLSKNVIGLGVTGGWPGSWLASRIALMKSSVFCFIVCFLNAIWYDDNVLVISKPRSFGRPKHNRLLHRDEI